MVFIILDMGHTYQPSLILAASRKEECIQEIQARRGSFLVFCFYEKKNKQKKKKPQGTNSVFIGVLSMQIVQTPAA